MAFLRSNIDRAIVMTWYDLRGFSHPLGFRFEQNTAKNLDAITCNLVAFAAHSGDDDEPTDATYVGYFESTFDEYLAMCKQLASDCDLSQAEAIRLIVEDIIKQRDKMEAEVADGTRTISPYLKTLSKDNRWGKAVLALQEAFASLPVQEVA